MGERKVERRKFTRFDVGVNIKFRIFDNPNVSESMKGKARNLSAEGMCIVTAKEVPGDKDIEIDVSLPGKKRPVRVRGKVIWAHRVKGTQNCAAGHFESGIKIYTVDKDDENTLLKYYCELIVDSLERL